MQLHEIRPVHQRKKRKRVGRGGKRGTYSGRGLKGQKSRSGHRLAPSIRSLIKRYPKLRGYKFNPRKNKPAVINLEILEKKFKIDDIVSPETLLKQGLIRKIKGKIPSVKVLSKGKLNKSLTFESCQLSKRAGNQIKKAGGTVKQHAVVK